MELAADAPEGLCPGCVLAACLQGQDGPQPSPVSELVWPEAEDSASPALDQLARAFPQLELLEVLGRGGMGLVYKANQVELGRLVALKILSPSISSDSAFAERFRREARALAALNHPNVVALHESGQSNGFYYFIMEYVEGANLRQLFETQRLESSEALGIVSQVCDALQYAHDEGIVHRDIKPENILLDKKGRVKIADFGLAKLVERSDAKRPLTGTGQAMGTPYYMAPEQSEQSRAVDHRADIYSLGVLLYEMLTGELPLGRFPPPSEKVQVDARLDRVVLRALEQEPDRRYQTISEMQTDVESIRTTTPDVVKFSSPTPLQRLASALNLHGSSRVTYGGIAALILLLVATVGYLLFGIGRLSSEKDASTAETDSTSIGLEGRQGSARLEVDPDAIRGYPAQSSSTKSAQSGTPPAHTGLPKSKESSPGDGNTELLPDTSPNENRTRPPKASSGAAARGAGNPGPDDESETSDPFQERLAEELVLEIVDGNGSVFKLRNSWMDYSYLKGEDHFFMAQGDRTHEVRDVEMAGIRFHAGGGRVTIPWSRIKEVCDIDEASWHATLLLQDGETKDVTFCRGEEGFRADIVGTTELGQYRSHVKDLKRITVLSEGTAGEESETTKPVHARRAGELLVEIVDAKDAVYELQSPSMDYSYTKGESTFFMTQGDRRYEVRDVETQGIRFNMGDGQVTIPWSRIKKIYDIDEASWHATLVLQNGETQEVDFARGREGFRAEIFGTTELGEYRSHVKYLMRKPKFGGPIRTALRNQRSTDV